MKTYEVSIARAGYGDARIVTIEAESESAVRQSWIDGGEGFDFDTYPDIERWYIAGITRAAR